MAKSKEELNSKEFIKALENLFNTSLPREYAAFITNKSFADFQGGTIPLFPIICRNKNNQERSNIMEFYDDSRHDYDYRNYATDRRDTKSMIINKLNSSSDSKTAQISIKNDLLNGNFWGMYQRKDESLNFCGTVIILNKVPNPYGDPLSVYASVIEYKDKVFFEGFYEEKDAKMFVNDCFTFLNNME
ncbi:MAG TPA: hypothetical protein PK358_12825 [Spirochaetota bacterium]|mgnify:FL=1|nr:hypothetical protein [Spirochaetota bacterium]HPJ35713.1 hypothetical protein [Spirochaetota bacterium]